MNQRVTAFVVLLSAAGCGAPDGGGDSFAARAGGHHGGSAGSAGMGAAGNTHVDGGSNAGSAETCGDGLDNNGDGHADEGCGCDVGKSQKCFIGAPSKAGQGVCAWGTQVCKQGTGSEFKSNRWGECTGYGKATTETCDGKDNDCNGTIDDGCDCQSGVEQACSSVCGDGKQACKAGKWGACDAPQPDSNGACPCQNGATQVCSTACGTGKQTCTNGKWTDCDAPNPGQNGVCPCNNGDTQPCSSSCGNGVQTCAGGSYGPCNAPEPDSWGQCPCPNGQIKGTDGNCYAASDCETVKDDGKLNVGAGQTESKTETCPPGLWATHGHYSGTKMPCEWSSTDTSVTLTCDNTGSSSARDADHVTIECSCVKPASVDLDCSNCG